ncbi:unnamed protein product [Paramecium primaurelia]|uniref:Uncharacterized protein n=1 Tax=Paramecium primaurelia TaxID=5886 RepID=A0A8S1QC93_PARPR|nr:unnamed protein product [Paramecium primaurelia]
MQQLIIFLGNQGSEKDQLFQLLPFEQKEIVFEKLIIKERIDQGEQKLIFINFPEENEITQAINSLLALSKYFIIRQIIICLHFVQSLPQRIQYIQKKFNEALNQEVENVYTFFISDSPQISYDNRLYQFSKIDESNKKIFIRILEEVSTPQYKRNSQICQTYLQQSVLNQQEQLQQKINNLNKQFQQEYLSTYLEAYLESKVQTLLSNEIQPFKMLDENIKQNKIALYSEAIYMLCYNEQDYSLQLEKFMGKWFKNFSFCTKCKILYQKQGYKYIIYQLSLFSLDQNDIDIEIRNRCISCKEQQLSQRLTIFIPFLFKIYIFQQIKNNLKMNEQFLVETTKNQLTQERIFNKKNKRDCIAILLLSNEDGLKQSVMQQVYDCKNYKESNEFKELQIINDSFYLIDSPIFQFDEYSEQLESIYSNYLNTTPIHYIIFCLKLQRSSLIKESLLSMSKKFPKINKQLFGAFIINQMNDDVSISSEHETINCIKELMPQTILIQNSNTSEDVIEKISDFIKIVDQTQPLSFEQTIFCKQDNESNQGQIENSLFLMSQNISDQFIQNCRQEIKNEELKQEKLKLQKQQFKQEISNLKNEYQVKKQDLKDLIYQIEQEIIEQERICKENVNNLENQIVQTDKDYDSSMFNIKEKKQQLKQMETEKMKRSYKVNYSNKKNIIV